MQVETLREYRRKQPFQPFRLHLSDGRTMDVVDPRLISVTRQSVAVGPPAPGYVGVAEQIFMLDPDDIVRVELLPESATAP